MTMLENALILRSSTERGKQATFFFYKVDPFKVWLLFCRCPRSLIQLHPVSDFAAGGNLLNSFDGTAARRLQPPPPPTSSRRGDGLAVTAGAEDPRERRKKPLLHIYSIRVSKCWCMKHSFRLLEPVCCKKWPKSPNQETGLGNMGHLKILKDTKLVLNSGSIWYHSEPLEVPYSPNQFLGWDFFCRFLQQTTGSRRNMKQIKRNHKCH